VTSAVLLDSGPLGLITNPKLSSQSIACTHWFQSLISKGAQFYVPEIADYEVRRELIRANKTQGIGRLDGLIGVAKYLPLTTQAMRQAAVFWAQARQQGLSTSGDKTIDADVILPAQAVMLGEPDVIVATTNVKHLSRFVPADLWQNIS
jgi:hypothetical protein